MVLIGERDVGVHEVDFDSVEIRPRRVVHLEPGQVHRWQYQSDFEATVVLFREVPIGSTPRWRLGSTQFDLTPAERARAQTVLDLIDEERKTTEGEAFREIALRALRDLLFVRLGLASEGRSVATELPPAYVAFLTDLEAHLSVASTMAERSMRLGYSARTISRACHQVAGRTAKQLVHERLVLEARRLLAQPTSGVANVAATLGFTEPTNFAKHFRRHTGVTPSDWIESLRQ